ncbi:MAG: transcriptional regulator NrdR [Chloroflexi bacterium]|nr:transcriptional regulator NrdR [Chloroflexota bacterium]
MQCPACGSDSTRVLDARAFAEGVRRRRHCPGCDGRFVTEERLQTEPLLVAKRDGRREPFHRSKLLEGLRRAAGKRPLPGGAVDAVAEAIEARLIASGRPEVESRVIGEMAIMQLRRLDPIAYIRFASDYRDFVSVDDMLDELQRLALSPGRPPDQPRLFVDEADRLVDGSAELPRVPLSLEDARERLAGPVTTG